MLHARAAVGDLVEPLGEAQLLLPRVVERAWSLATTDRSPVRRPAHRAGQFDLSRRGGEQMNLAPSKPGHIEVVDGQGEVLRAGLPVDGLAPVPAARISPSARVQLTWTM